MNSLALSLITTATLLLAIIPQPVTAQVPGPELLQNGDFESCDLEPGWASRPGPTFDGSVTNSVAHTGNCSLELQVLDIVRQAFQQAVTTQGVLTFWLQAPSNACRSLSAIIEYEDQTSASQPFICTPDWTHVSFRFDATKNVSAVIFGTGEVTGKMYIDDVLMPGLFPEREQLPDSARPRDDNGNRTGASLGARLCQFLFRGNKTLCILGAIVATLAGLGGLLFLYRRLSGR